MYYHPMLSLRFYLFALFFLTAFNTQDANFDPSNCSYHRYLTSTIIQTVGLTGAGLSLFTPSL